MPIHSLWPALLLTLLALVPGAAYVSVINDLTDREEDRASGKPNRLAGRSRWLGGLLVLLTAGTGVALCILWRDDALLVSIYLCAWIAFSLYSLPPFRFKNRGLLGVLADASGANLFPTLVAVILAFRGAQKPVVLWWMVAVGAWALANGIRGILWHQLADIENDRQAGIRTFASLHPASTLVRIGTFVVFPIELLALAAMLVQMRSWWPVGALAAYALLIRVRLVRWQTEVLIVAPKARVRIVMHEYYDALLPPAILIASACRYSYDWIVLIVHLLLFPTRTGQVLTTIGKLWRGRVYGGRWLFR